MEENPVSTTETPQERGTATAPLVPPSLRALAALLTLGAAMELFFAVSGADLRTGVIAVCWVGAAALLWFATSGSLGLRPVVSPRVAAARMIVVLLVVLVLLLAPMFVGA